LSRLTTGVCQQQLVSTLALDETANVPWTSLPVNGTRPADGTVYEASDTPNSQTSGTTEVRGTWTFETYIMFSVHQTTAIPVAVKKMTYGLGFCAPFVNNVWTIKNPSRTPQQGDPSWSDEGKVVLWSANATDYLVQTVTCPLPC
jgi:hypothetical protein